MYIDEIRLIRKIHHITEKYLFDVKKLKKKNLRKKK